MRGIIWGWVMTSPFWRSQAPLLAYFALSGAALRLWAFSKLGLMFAVEFAIPGLLAGLQWLLDRGMLVARVEVVAAIVGPLGLAPGAMAVLDIAHSEAERAGHGAIEAEDILNAIVSEGEGASAGILESLGAEGSTMLQPGLRQGAGS